MGRESICVCMFVCLLLCETIIQTRDDSNCCLMSFGVCWLNQGFTFSSYLLSLDPGRGKVGRRRRGGRQEGERKE